MQTTENRGESRPLPDSHISFNNNLLTRLYVSAKGDRAGREKVTLELMPPTAEGCEYIQLAIGGRAAILDPNEFQVLLHSMKTIDQAFKARMAFRHNHRLAQLKETKLRNAEKYAAHEYYDNTKTGEK